MFIPRVNDSSLCDLTGDCLPLNIYQQLSNLGCQLRYCDPITEIPVVILFSLHLFYLLHVAPRYDVRYGKSMNTMTIKKIVGINHLSSPSHFALL